MTDEIIEPVSEQLEELAASAEIDPFRIYVKAGALNIRDAPGYEGAVVGTLLRKETRTIEEESNGWGRLSELNGGRKSNGTYRPAHYPPGRWINLDFCKKTHYYSRELRKVLEFTES